MEDPRTFSYCQMRHRSFEGTTQSKKLAFLMPEPPRIPVAGKYDRVIQRKILGSKIPDYGSSRVRDELLATKFLKNSREGVVPDCVTSYLFNGEPLANFLIQEAQCNKEGWRFPSGAFLKELLSKSGFGKHTARHVRIEELLLSDYSDPNDKFSLFLGLYKEKGLNELPMPFTSLDIEDVQIYRSDYQRLKRLVRENRNNPKFIYECPIPSLNDSEPRDSIPARLAFGDGVTWMGIIRTPITKHKGKFRFDFHPIRRSAKAWQTLFDTFSTLVGVGIAKDVKDYLQFLTDFYDFTPYFAATVDLASIALVLGYTTRKTGLFTLNLLFTGTPLCKVMSCADNRWGDEDLPDCFLAYLIADIKSGHILATVMLSMLIRNMFPDPSTLCTLLGRDQRKAMWWFSWVVFTCLKDVLPSASPWDCTSRRTLANCLVNQDNVTPQRVVYFSEMLPDFLHLTAGGPRDLHYVRQTFRSQMFHMNKLDIQFGPKVDYSSAVRDPSYTFGRAEVTQNLGATDSPMLRANPAYKDDIFNPYDHAGNFNITTAWIRRHTQQSGRNTVDAIMEWLYLRQDHLFTLAYDEFHNLDLLSQPYYEIWGAKVSLYEKIMLHIDYRFDIDAPRVPILEKLIEYHRDNSVNQEKGSLARAENEVERKKLRLELMNANALRSGVGSSPKSGVANRVFAQIPGSQTLRNRRRSRARKQRLKDKIGKGVFVPRQEFRFRKLQTIRRGLSRAQSGQPSPVPSASQQMPSTSLPSAALQDSERYQMSEQIRQLKAQVANLSEVVNHYRSNPST